MHTDTIQSHVLRGMATLCALGCASASSAQYWTPGPGDPALAPDVPNNIIYALLDDENASCYAGGSFNAPYSAVAHWDGTQWSAAGAPCWDEGSSVYALIEYNGRLFAGGDFIADPNPEVSGDETHFGLAMRMPGLLPGLPEQWVPVTWQGAYLEGVVYALDEFDGKLIVGGDFTTPNGIKNICQWDNWNWSQLGGGNGANGTIYALATKTTSQGFNRLYAGGEFTNIGSSGTIDFPMHEQNLAVFNGGGWSQGLGAANGIVKALYAVEDGSMNGLYIGGWFDRIGGTFGLNHVARWDGSTMYALDGGTNGAVEAFTFFQSPSFDQCIAVGGQFTLVDWALNVQNVAAWNSDGWQAMDLGVSDASSQTGAVEALCSAPGGCYAGGDIAQCGSDFKLTEHIARFVDLDNGRYSLEHFVNFSDNARWDGLDGPNWRLSAEDDDADASCNWGVDGADCQGIGWDPDSFNAGERLTLTVDRQDGFGFDATFSMAGQTFRSFMPHFISFDFQPHTSTTEDSLQLVTLSDGSVAEHALPASGQLQIQGSVHSAVLSNGHYWDRSEVVIVNLTEGSSIISESGIVENVSSFGIIWPGSAREQVGPFDLSLQGDLVIDTTQSGFGFQNNFHKMAGVRDFALENGELALEMEQDGILDVLAVINSLTGDDSEQRHMRSEMSFAPQNAGTNWSLEITLKGGIVVGNPADTFRVDGREDGSFGGAFQSNDDDMEETHVVRAIMADGSHASAEIPFGYLEFGVLGVDSNRAYNVGFDSSTGGGFINWDEPGTLVFQGNHNLPNQDGIVGLIIEKKTRTDDEAIENDLEECSLSIRTQNAMGLRILDEQFTRISGEPEKIAGDINGDGEVNGQDLAQLLGAWGSDDPDADLNGDGLVNGQDLAELLGSWT